VDFTVEVNRSLRVLEAQNEQGCRGHTPICFKNERTSTPSG
jgi:hypothetical protein